MNIVFFGSGQYVVPVVDAVKAHGSVLVITTERQGSLTNYLQRNNIENISTALKDPQEVGHIKKINPTIGVLASYGAIIPEKVIQMFPHGILNIHPSLLPKYKGPSPVQYAIKNGDKKTGVTVIKLDNQIDHGPIVLQKEYELNGSETFSDLTEELFKVGAEMIDEVLTEFEQTNTIYAVSQDHFKQSFTEKVEKNDGYININNPPSKEELDRMIRAYYPWPGVWTRTQINGDEKIVKLFPNDKIQVEGKNVMTYKDFINGYGEAGEKILASIGV